MLKAGTNLVPVLMFYSFHIIGTKTYYYYTDFSLILGTTASLYIYYTSFFLILGTTDTPKYYDIFRFYLNF